MDHGVKDGGMVVIFFFREGGERRREGLTGLDNLTMGVSCDEQDGPLGPAAVAGPVRVANMARLWRGFVWRVPDALAPVKKEKRCRPPPCKQQAARRAGIQAFRQPGSQARLLGWACSASWGLVLLTFDADDADEAWVALCQAGPESLTLRSLVEVVVSVVGS